MNISWVPVVLWLVAVGAFVFVAWRGGAGGKGEFKLVVRERDIFRFVLVGVLLLVVGGLVWLVVEYAARPLVNEGAKRGSIDWSLAVYWLTMGILFFWTLRYDPGMRNDAAVKRNRASGVYDDPEFKRRIRPLNVLRWSAAAVMFVVFGIEVFTPTATSTVRNLLWVLAWVILAVFGTITRRWRKLMREGA